MRIPMRISLSLFAMGVFLLASSACTTDNTTDTISSTTPGMWYTGDGLVKSEYRAIAFTTLNFENLKHDMALGRGEYVASLGTLLGVPDAHQSEFLILAREKYPILFASERTTPGEMLTALNQALKSDPTLNRTVLTN